MLAAVISAAVILALILVVTFTRNDKQAPQEGMLAGTVQVDGSSTVFPITEAVAEEFQKVHRRVRVTVGISGTGGGFKKFCIGETDINDASRPIKLTEIAKASENNISFIELPVAFDGISVLVNPQNHFVDFLTVEELRKIWQPGSTVKKWSDVRPNWPDWPITLYGPGTDSGTFDYFTKAINGKEQACRPDFTASEDDNVLVQGIAGDKNALGFFGYAYYAENRSILKVVPIQTAKGPIAPSEVTINNGTYQPLSRPIFIYISKQSAERLEVDKFVKFYLQNAPTLTKEVGYVPLPAKIYQSALRRFEQRKTGSVFSGGATVGLSLKELLNAEK
ncbi:MAG: phosphate ABC transporter substrate-binding protein PstS family protein [Actinobacteria bacterium]|nr:phosphate ABC transporter substrate-binding protein PstS family protein [Actinomycetota bacterium]